MSRLKTPLSEPPTQIICMDGSYVPYCTGCTVAQQKMVRIMTGSKHKTSRKPLFQSLKILTIPSEYILSLIKWGEGRICIQNVQYGGW
jgi:hypothetical protein